MKNQTIENVILDEVHHRTFTVMASRVLTDGELYWTIRKALLKRSSRVPIKGEQLVIKSIID